jgi:hypothetical protein
MFYGGNLKQSVVRLEEFKSENDFDKDEYVQMYGDGVKAKYVSVKSGDYEKMKTAMKSNHQSANFFTGVSMSDATKHVKDVVGDCKMHVVKFGDKKDKAVKKDDKKDAKDTKSKDVKSKDTKSKDTKSKDAKSKDTKGKKQEAKKKGKDSDSDDDSDSDAESESKSSVESEESEAESEASEKPKKKQSGKDKR